MWRAGRLLLLLLLPHAAGCAAGVWLPSRPGAPPFNADTPEEIFSRILDCQVEFLTDPDTGEHVISEACRDFIASLLQVQRSQAAGARGRLRMHACLHPASMPARMRMHAHVCTRSRLRAVRVHPLRAAAPGRP